MKKYEQYSANGEAQWNGSQWAENEEENENNNVKIQRKPSLWKKWSVSMSGWQPELSAYEEKWRETDWEMRKNEKKSMK